MNPAPELAPQLKQLRLSGILDSLEARNREAIQAKLAYTDFLALLISDEVARREQKKFSTRLRRAQFRTTKTLEQFDFDFQPSIDRRLVRELGVNAPVIAGGIIPEDDRPRLLDQGVAAVYTPKDFELAHIMGEVLDLVG